MREFCTVTSLTLLLSLVVMFSIQTGLAQVMGSTNYQIQSDSVNIGGGLGSSPSYQLESTAGEIATGLSNSGSYGLRAGFQQMQDSYIALSSSGNVALLPTIGGVVGGYATGTAIATVITDSPGGYQLQISAEDSPAMQKGGDSISDYVTGTVDPDFNFSVASHETGFGFSPEGSHIVQRYLDATGSCNQSGGSDTTDACWDGLSTTARTISLSNDSNHPSGTDTTIKFQVGVGGSVGLAPGIYVATTTITATAL